MTRIRARMPKWRKRRPMPTLERSSISCLVIRIGQSCLNVPGRSAEQIHYSISNTIAAAYYLYSAPFEIVVASIFLYKCVSSLSCHLFSSDLIRILGWSAFAGVVVLFVAVPLNAFVSKRSIRVCHQLTIRQRGARLTCSDHSGTNESPRQAGHGHERAHQRDSIHKGWFGFTSREADDAVLRLDPTMDRSCSGCSFSRIETVGPL